MNKNVPIHSPESLIYKSYGNNGIIFSNLMVDNDGDVYFKACIPPENLKFDMYKRDNKWQMFMEGMGKKANTHAIEEFDINISSEALSQNLESFSNYLALKTEMAIVIPSAISRKEMLLLKVDVAFPSRLLMLESIADSFIDEVLSDIKRPIPDAGHVSVESCQAWILPEEAIENIKSLWKASKVQPCVLLFSTAEKMLSAVSSPILVSVAFDSKKTEDGRFEAKIISQDNKTIGVLPNPEYIANNICLAVYKPEIEAHLLPDTTEMK